MKTSAIFTLIAFLLNCQAISQNQTWYNFTSGTKITAVVEDDSYTWISTAGGLVKKDYQSNQSTFFNGTNSGLPHSDISSMDMASDGSLWMGTYYGGLVHFSGSSWQAYNTWNSGILFNRVSALVVDNNDIVWMANDKYYNNPGLLSFDGSNWTNYTTDNSGLPNNKVTGLSIMSNGAVLIGTYGGGVAVFDGIVWTVYKKENSGLPGNYVMAVEAGEDNKIWIGYEESSEMGIASFDGETWEIYDHNNSILPYSSVYNIAASQNGIWVSVNSYYAAGIFYYDGNNWLNYNSLNSGLIHDNIDYLEVTENGILWVGTQKGLVSFDGNVWTPQNTSNSGIPRDNRLLSLALDNEDKLWMGSWDGLLKFDGISWEVYHDQNSGIWSNSVVDITFDSEWTLWMNLDNGPNYNNRLSSFDGTTFEFHDPPTSYYGEISGPISIDKDDKKWFRVYAPSNGLCRYYQNSWHKFDSASTGVDLAVMTSIAIDTSNTLWCGVYDYLVSYDIPFWNGHAIPNLSGASINELTFDENNILWGAMYNKGAFRKEGENWEVFKTDNSDLPSNIVNDIAFDADNQIWFATQNGLACYDGENWVIYKKGNSGLPYNVVESIIIDETNNKWILCKNAGLAVFNEAGVWVNANEQTEIKKVLGVYPNPADNFINVALQNINATGEVSLLSSDGRKLQSKNISNNLRIDIQGLSKGIYFLKVRGSDKNYTTKFIKK